MAGDGEPGQRADAGVRPAWSSRLASAALLLTDRQASYITGTVVPVDGGWTAH
jgi:NAD(P)-dependent dehydrogenase (short-subunit alcohol dehydrogenase family)